MPVYKLFACLAIFLLLAGCAASTPSEPPSTPLPSGPKPVTSETGWEARWNKVLQEAKKEGSVTVYSTLGNDGRKEVQDGFQKRFGMPLEFVAGRGPEVANRAVSERVAGVHLADAFILGTQTIIYSLKPNNIPAPIEPSLILPEVKEAKLWIGGQIPYTEKDHMGIGLAAAYDAYVTINTEMVKPGEIASYQDLLNPKYKGKIAMFDPIRDGTGQSAIAHIDYVLGDQEGKNFLRGLVKQEPVISADYRQVAEWLARGKYAIGLGSRIEETVSFMSLGAPLSKAKPKEGGKIGAAGASLSLADKPAHANAAIVFANWILGKEGGAYLQKGFGNPSARMDVPKDAVEPLLLAGPDDKFYIEDEETIRQARLTVEFAKDVFGPLMK